MADLRYAAAYNHSHPSLFSHPGLPHLNNRVEYHPGRSTVGCSTRLPEMHPFQSRHNEHAHDHHHQPEAQYTPGATRPQYHKLPEHQFIDSNTATVKSCMKKLANTLHEADQLFRTAYKSFETATKDIKAFVTQELLANIWKCNIQNNKNTTGKQIATLEEQFFAMAGDLRNQCKNAEAIMANSTDPYRMAEKIRAIRHDMETHDATSTWQECRGLSLDIRDMQHTIQSRYETGRPLIESRGSSETRVDPVRAGAQEPVTETSEIAWGNNDTGKGDSNGSDTAVEGNNNGW